jgi:hypothetical protein
MPWASARSSARQEPLVPLYGPSLFRRHGCGAPSSAEGRDKPHLFRIPHWRLCRKGTTEDTERTRGAGSVAPVE